MNAEAQLRHAQAVCMEDMLDARERRAARQKGLIGKHGCPLISYTLNIPGQYKVYPLTEKAFYTGWECIVEQLRRMGAQINEQVTIEANTGYEAFFAVRESALNLKKQMAVIEEGHPLGRLFDIDGLDAEGHAVRRSATGQNERSCIICEKPVWACARSRAHTAEELTLCTAAIMQEYFHSRYADWTAESATKALLYEVAATPKPGLVDRCNNGAHSDMDLFRFIDSSVALTSFFRGITLYVLHYEGAPGALLPLLRYPGQLAEAKMFSATHEINTHKGAIFTFGLLCASVGLMLRDDAELSPEGILALCAEIAGTVTGELTGESSAQTNGERVFAAVGLTGVRGEAARGYPHVLKYGYPALQRSIAAGYSLNDAGAIALLHLIAHLDDTNVISRSDMGALQDIRGRVAERLRNEDDCQKLLAFAEELDREFIKQNISPGGSADLLAVSYFLHFLLHDADDTRAWCIHR